MMLIFGFNDEICQWQGVWIFESDIARSDVITNIRDSSNHMAI